MLEDYAAIVEAWLMLYQATGSTQWFERAVAVLDVALEIF